MAKYLVFICSLFLVCYARELAPFIAWSNSDFVNDVIVSDDVNKIIESLLSKVKDVDNVVIFTSNELSFDEFNKYANVYGSQKSSQFTQLKAAIDSSLSYYWTGVKPTVEGDWIAQLASAQGKEVVYVSDTVYLSKPGKELAVFELKDFSSQDDIISNVMDDFLSKPFLAIYVHSSTIKHFVRSRRTVSDYADPIIREREVVIEEREAFVGAGQTASTSCRIGGVFNSTNNSTNNSTSPCLMFCLNSMNISFILKEEALNCSLTTPYSVMGCCSDEVCGSDDSCYGDSTPSVALNFTATNTNDTMNYCSNSSYDTVDIVIKFLFPLNNETRTWSVQLQTLVTVTTMNDISQQYFDSVQRANPNPNLFEAFQVNRGLSYACSASQYSRYFQSLNLTNDSTRISLNSFQVQPYAVKSNAFATAYNCEGYFTATTWMGIVTVSVLLLILYMSILCVFSMQSIDKFEDPRGQSISVEKLH